MRSKLLARLAFALLLAEILLVLLSWLLSAVPTAEVRSLLTGEGLRWLLGRMSEGLSTPVLVWLVLLGMAWGCLGRSGLLQLRASLSHPSSRDRVALVCMSVLVVLYVGVMLLLTVTPHAILLSATGALFPSPFSASIVPVVSFGVTLCAILYGIVSGRINSLADIYLAMLQGIRDVAPLLFFYILFTQIYYTLRFVFP